MRKFVTKEAHAVCLDCGTEWSTEAAALNGGRHASAAGHTVRMRTVTETVAGPLADVLRKEAEARKVREDIETEISDIDAWFEKSRTQYPNSVGGTVWIAAEARRADLVRQLEVLGAEA